MNALFAASPLYIGTQGLKQSMDRMGEHAQNMQQAQARTHSQLTNNDTVNLSEPAEYNANLKQYNSDEQLIYTSQSALEAKANTKVIQTSLDQLGTIINMKV